MDVNEFVAAGGMAMLLFFIYEAVKALDPATKARSIRKSAMKATGKRKVELAKEYLDLLKRTRSEAAASSVYEDGIDMFIKESSIGPAGTKIKEQLFPISLEFLSEAISRGVVVEFDEEFLNRRLLSQA